MDSGAVILCSVMRAKANHNRKLNADAATKNKNSLNNLFLKHMSSLFEMILNLQAEQHQTVARIMCN